MASTDRSLAEIQRRVCERFGALPLMAPTGSQKVGVARNVTPDAAPLHGLRHPSVDDTSGWYIWVGELSDARDFFQPVHVEHLSDICPGALPYLGLPPGWRFLIAPGYEDVWEDATLLDP